MSDLAAQAQDAWRTSVVKDFAASELFDRTFQEGMALVEETAALFWRLRSRHLAGNHIESLVAATLDSRPRARNDLFIISAGLA